MEYRHVARLLLSALCALQGVAQMAIDLNRTHATNPRWTGHARFHLVWQTSTVAVLAAVQLYLIWPGHAFYLALVLAAVSPAGFLIAFLSRALYDGRLADPNGIPPLRLKLGRHYRAVDLNLVAVIVALCLLCGLALTYAL